MVLISITAALTGICIIYIVLKKQIYYYRTKKTSILIREIEKWECNLLLIHEEMNKYYENFKTLEDQEEVVRQNLTHMETNNRNFINNKKLQMNKYYEELIEKDGKILENMIIDRIFTSLLKEYSECNREGIKMLIEQIKPFIGQQK